MRKFKIRISLPLLSNHSLATKNYVWLAVSTGKPQWICHNCNMFLEKRATSAHSQDFFRPGTFSTWLRIKMITGNRKWHCNNNDCSASDFLKTCSQEAICVNNQVLCASKAGTILFFRKKTCSRHYIKLITERMSNLVNKSLEWSIFDCKLCSSTV